YSLKKTSFTGEPIDDETARFCEATFGTRMCSMYGTTEIGVIMASFPGADDFPTREGSLGKPLPGIEIAVLTPDGSPTAAGEIGELMVRRGDEWVPTKDRAWIDEDGFYFHA